MAKITLDIDALQVESFSTASANPERGTVHARSTEPEPVPSDVGLLPITDWKTCQGADCTARTLCYYGCTVAVETGGVDFGEIG